MVDQDMLVFLVKRIIEEFFRVFTKYIHFVMQYTMQPTRKKHVL